MGLVISAATPQWQYLPGSTLKLSLLFLDMSGIADEKFILYLDLSSGDRDKEMWLYIIKN